MSVLFQPDVCLAQDPAGFGMWRDGHAYEHDRMRLICSHLTIPILVPDYDIRSWRDERELVQRWLQTHELIHEVLRSATNITGSDLSLVDFSQHEEFYEWMDDHAQEHAAFRQVLNAG